MKSKKNRALVYERAPGAAALDGKGKRANGLLKASPYQFFAPFLVLHEIVCL